MEAHQEVIEVVSTLYFKAKAQMKYRGDRHEFLSEKHGYDHFSLATFYDIQVGSAHADSVMRISEKEFKSGVEKSIRIQQTSGDGVLWKAGKSYRFSPDLFYFEPTRPKHVQINDDELHGYFEQVTVFFKTHRVTNRVVCKEGFETGRTEVKEDGDYIEVYLRDCSTAWIKKTKVGVSDPDPDIPISEPPKGPIPTPPIPGPQGPSVPPMGCWEMIRILLLIVVYGFGLLYFVGFIALLIHSSLWIPLAVFFSMLLLVWLIQYMGGWLSRFPRFTQTVGSGLRWLLTLLITLLVLRGVGELFSTTQKERNTSGKNRTELTPTPKPRIEPVTDSDEEIKKERDELRISIQWRDLRDSLYQGSYNIAKSDINASLSNLNNTYIASQNQYGALYSKLSHHDAPSLSSMYSMLDSIRNSNKLTEIQFAQLIVSMVQSQEYVLILDESCTDVSLRTDSDLQAMFRSGIGCEGNYKFGVKPPTKFAVDWKGDCDTRTVLLYTILKHFKYDVAIINSTYYKHSMLGINLENGRGAFKVHSGKPYYFWETTSRGFNLGELPRGSRNINFWNVVLN
jgi:hypothetical protein